MAKYKCLNPECNHIVVSDEEPSNCSNCGESNFEKASDSSPLGLLKKYWWIGAILIALIVIIRCCGGAPTITATFDKNKSQLTVQLEKGAPSDYSLEIKRNGATYSTLNFKNKGDTKQTFETSGNYTVNVKTSKKYTGQGNGWSFSIDEKIIPQVAPQILTVNIGKTDVKKQLYLDITVVCDTSVKSPNIEYSKDGTNYQKSIVFTNLSPGTYSFYARNTKDNSKVSPKFDKTLPTIKKESPPDHIINDLLRKIAKGDDNAYDKWRNDVESGILIPVSVAIGGITNSTQLIDYVNATGTYIPIKTTRDSNNKIIKITK
jgi:hypothetical protein